MFVSTHVTTRRKVYLEKLRVTKLLETVFFGYGTGRFSEKGIRAFREPQTTSRQFRP
jgi:hypothetical protein